MKKEELKCNKCGVHLIIEIGCISTSGMEEKHNRKEITYYLSGETSYIPLTIPCVKCENNIITIKPSGGCPKCNLPIYDSDCAMDDRLAEMEKNKEINFIVGKTLTQFEVQCVKCRTKFKYDRYRGVVK